MSFLSPKKLYFIFILISLSLSDNVKELKPLVLEQKVKGKMDENESREYYELKLPNDIKRGNLLVFTVKESRKGVREGDELFSDPDIYVSKSNKFPSNREEASWFSERYGNDILTIPSYAVEPDEVFYICMYCQYKCRYELNSYISKEAPAEVGKFYDINLSNKASMSYALYVPKNDNDEELNVIAFNPSLKNFRIFMAKESPSSQNTFTIIPSWEGGYTISVSKYNKDYCKDCYYHILFQTEEENVKISFTAYFQSTLSKINVGNVINDVVKAGSKRCYYFDTSLKRNLYDAKLIFNINLFSGNVLLDINGWTSNNEDRISFIKTKPYSYNIENDKSILLQKADFDSFDKEYNPEDPTQPKNLYFCIHGQQMSSYILSINFLSEIESLQRYNIISPGSELTGYLQGGQVTKYSIMDYNLNKNSIITISFTQLEGRVEFFSAFCLNNCEYNDEILKNKLQMGQVILASNSPNAGNKKIIEIKPEDNICYKQTQEDQIQKCETLALVKCFGNSDDICSFKILPSLNDKPIFMAPKKTYYNVIAKGKEDLYEILVSDEEINSIVVVLTSVTGDAELQVSQKKDEYSLNSDKLGFQSKSSRNKDYIPDVVRITPNMLGTKSVVGKYTVKITAASFSSYNLYYYTTRIKSKEESPNMKDITLSLNEGNIIKDYFPNDIEYKIFSYTPQLKAKEDIKIILTRINVHFSFKVYLDFNKIKYNYDIKSKFEEALSGYDWASDHNNELTISKDDSKYSVDGPYYIVVTKDNAYKDEESEELDQRSIMSYYLGVTKRGLAFTLNEGVEHSVTISEQYNYQDYFYIHKDVNNPLNLELNILNGEVDVFINVKQLIKDDITKVYENLEKSNLNNNNYNLNEKDDIMNSLYMKLNIDTYASIELDNLYFQKYCAKKINVEFNDKSCYLYIYVIQSRLSKKYHRDSQYIISAKSSLNTGTVLLSGQVYNVQSKENKIDHYIIEEIKHRKGIAINVFFKKGSGKLFVRIPNTPEIGKNITYPDENNFDYQGIDTYMGKIVQIPSKVFDRINSNSVKLQIFISVIPDISEVANTEYSISYGSEPKRISQNVPYQSYLSAGEMHYFTFYFDESTENIYISLSNMNGDADMYLNYGNDKLPTVNEFHWSSNYLGHEYLDINIKDNFFKRNKMKNISGYYTLLIIGYTETTYTLYISSHADKIFSLYDNMPVNCRCQIQGEKCYFRYNDVFKSFNNNINKNEIIFTTQYTYGNGKMYASIYKEQELTEGTNKKYQEFFPTENKAQFSNALTGKRNYLKVIAEGDDYLKDSLILLTYICSEKTDVEITAASLQYDAIMSFIDPNRENMFYLKYNDSLASYNQEESIFNFFSFIDESIIYELHAYMGSARVKIYTNESYYDERSKTFKFDYNHIAEFNIRAEQDEHFYFLKTYTESYFNSIKNKLIYNKNVFFKIKPMSDFGFYIQVTYDKSWVTPPIGEPKSYLINKDQLYGYFDISPEFSNVEFSLTLDEFVQKRAHVYIKILVGEKDEKKISQSNDEDKLYHYDIPSKNKCDYKGKTDEYIGAININLNNLPILKNNERNNKFIKALFAIDIQKNTFKKRAKQPSASNKENLFDEPDLIDNMNNPLNTENKNEPKEEVIKTASPTTKVTITITPGINNFKRIDLPQHTYYFSNTSLVQNYNYDSNNQQKSYDGNKEVKIYSLDKRSNEDKKMVIQIHTCAGKYNYKITKNIVDYDNNPNDILVSQASDEYGRSKYLIDNLRDKHIYLSIKSAQNPNDCINGKDSEGKLCDNELSYLIYYYSLTDNEYFSRKQNLILGSDIKERENLNQIKIGLFPLSGMDRFKNIREQNAIEYNLFYTIDENLKDKLDNICYLSQIMSLTDSSDFNGTMINNISIIKNIELDERNQYLIDNLDSIDVKDRIFINVLARNIKTNELIAYVPLSVILEKRSFAYKKIFIVLLVICLLFIVIYATHSYLQTKSGDGFQYKSNATEMDSIHSKTGGYQRINLSKL